MKTSLSLRPSSPLHLVILVLLNEEPMHPYRMYGLIRERGKDQVANVSQRNSVYQTIHSLQNSGLISVLQTSRDELRPERTVYEITEEGRRAVKRWMIEMIASPAREFPEFPAALAHVGLLRRKELGELLQRRYVVRTEKLAAAEKEYPGIPRVFLLESEYQAAILRAELKWLRAIIEELKSGVLAWKTCKSRTRNRSL